MGFKAKEWILRQGALEIFEEKVSRAGLKVVEVKGEDLRKVLGSR